MDSRQFAKLCRDAGLVNRKLTTTACDLAFAKVAKVRRLLVPGTGPNPCRPYKLPLAHWICRRPQLMQGTRKLSFRVFLEAVGHLAAEKGVARGEHVF